MSSIGNIRDDATRNVSTASQAAPVYYRFGVASNLRRRVITTLPAIKTAARTSA